MIDFLIRQPPFDGALRAAARRCTRYVHLHLRMPHIRVPRCGVLFHRASAASAYAEAARAPDNEYHREQKKVLNMRA